MATSKRDRQRANREARRQVEEQLQRRDTMMGRIKRFGAIALVVLAVVVGANLIWGGDDEAPDTVTTTSLPVATSTTDASTTSENVTSTTLAETDTTSG